jgi:hypothetical protein
MTIKSEITKNDYSKLMMRHLMRTPYMFVIVGVGLGSLIFYFQSPDLGTFYHYLGLAFIALPFLTYFNFDQAYKANKHFSEKIEFVFEDDKLELIGQTFRSSFKWDQIARINESEDFFALFRGRVLFAAINKRGIDAQTVDALRNLLKSKVKI